MNAELRPYLKENARHGSAGFPMGFYHCEVPEDFVNLLAHWHEELEVTLVRGGRLHYAVGLTSFEAAEGELLLILPNTLHAARQIDRTRAVTDSVVFHPRMLASAEPDVCTSRFIRPLLGGTLRPPARVRPDEPLYGAFRRCFETLWACRQESDPLYPLRAKAAALELTGLIWRGADGGERDEAPRQAGLHEEKIKLVLSYLQAHYAEPVSVSALAAMCGFSQAHFMNLFKRYMNCTCVKYINELRLAHAALALEEGGETVMQAALDCGFSNISYFNRMFKQKYRMTPREYRASRGTGRVSGRRAGEP